jgi:hypothetical protein
LSADDFKAVLHGLKSSYASLDNKKNSLILFTAFPSGMRQRYATEKNPQIQRTFPRTRHRTLRLQWALPTREPASAKD